jgi:N-acetyl-gamma-glutamyl-phosphate reductase
VILDGKSGTTGAGRKAEESLLFAEVAENLRAYRVAKHQHTPEIEQVLSRVARREVRVSFTAHLIPMRRGILVTAYLAAKPGVTQLAIDGAIAKLAEHRPFLRHVARPPETQRTIYNNLTELGATLDPRTGTIVSFAALDNLVKGAAGQAIQNFNLMLGLPGETGLVSP